jgi:hypothetical protein
MRNDNMSFTRWTACAALIATLTASPAAAQTEQTKYHVAGPAGVTIRNVRDDSGIPVGKFGEGTVLAVHGTMGSWTQVEPAGGLTCWVLGAYLKETETSGRFTVTGNGVNMRPLASSGNGSFPMMQRLYAGDMVRMVGRDDPSAPFEEDWIQIRTPKGVHGWAPTSTIKPAPDPAQAGATWTGEWAEILEAMGAPQKTTTVTTGDEPTAPDTETEGDLVRARRMMNESPPRYTEAKAIYSAVLAKAPSGSPVALSAKNGLIQADAYASIEELQRKLEKERVDREQREVERQAELDRRSSEDTPLKGRYDARGWVESRPMPNGEMAWYLRFGGKNSCRIQCTSGRYDVGMYEGYEVGVAGRMTNEAGAAQVSCDMRSIEVLSGRSAR